MHEPVVVGAFVGCMLGALLALFVTDPRTDRFNTVFALGGIGMAMGIIVAVLFR